jgi:hypothetical protein
VTASEPHHASRTWKPLSRLKAIPATIAEQERPSRLHNADGVTSRPHCHAASWLVMLKATEPNRELDGASDYL